MTANLPLELARPPRAKFYYGWINLWVAALAMVATLPGRTQGIGLITQALLDDFKLDADEFSLFNIWITLIGSTFCLAVGPLIDRFGARIVLAVNMAALGGAVLAMSFVRSASELFVALLLTRGLGQSALSVVSLAIVGKWFSKKLPMAMALFALLTGIGFIIAFPGMKFAADAASWRAAWFWMGVVFLGAILPLGVALVRRTPESIGVHVDGAGRAGAAAEPPPAEISLTLSQALRTPIFWIFALSTAAYALLNTGLMLFNTMLLKAHNADDKTIYAVLGIVVFAGLLFNFLGGYLARTWRLGSLMGGAMFLLALSLLALPAAGGPALIYAYAFLSGAAGGIIMVIFFICWGKLFGRRHLGAIQGAAQILTVIASAVGPWLLTETIRLSGSSNLFFHIAAPIVALLGLASLLAPPPRL